MLGWAEVLRCGKDPEAYYGCYGAVREASLTAKLVSKADAGTSISDTASISANKIPEIFFFTFLSFLIDF